MIKIKSNKINDLPGGVLNIDLPNITLAQVNPRNGTSTINLHPTVTNLTIHNINPFPAVIWFENGICARFNSEILGEIPANVKNINIYNANNDKLRVVEIGDNSILWINFEETESIAFSDNSSLNFVINNQRYFINTPNPFLAPQNVLENLTRFLSLKEFLNNQFQNPSSTPIELGYVGALREYQDIKSMLETCETNLFVPNLFDNIDKNIAINFPTYTGVRNESLKICWIEVIASFLNLRDISLTPNQPTIQIEEINIEHAGEQPAECNIL